MKRSYAEDETTKHEVDRQRSLQQLMEDIGSLEQLHCSACATDLEHYYVACARRRHLQMQMQVLHMWIYMYIYIYVHVHVYVA